MIYFAKWKIALILVVLLGGIVFASPNVLPRSVVEQFPDWLPARQVSLGLDLQGGSHLLMEVGVKAVVEELLA